jgi:hypothetical protein
MVKHGLISIGNKKLYSELVVEWDKRKFQLTISPKDSKTSDEIKNLLKAKVNPKAIKVRITSLRPLKDGGIRIEAGSKETEKPGGKDRRKMREEL